MPSNRNTPPTANIHIAMDVVYGAHGQGFSEARALLGSPEASVEDVTLWAMSTLAAYHDALDHGALDNGPGNEGPSEY